MGAVSQVIPNLLGGVSQQPDPIKLPGQVREASNVYLDPTFGCRKRPPIRYIADLGADVPTDAKWFPIFRDAEEHYVAAVYDDNGTPTLRVWDAFTGDERPLTYQGNARDYLAATDYRDLQTMTINDYTFIANPEVTVAVDGNSTSDIGYKEALCVVTTAAYNTTYALDFTRDGASGGTTTVYSAAGISISPRQYRKEDGGSGTDQGSWIKTLSSGAKTGLSVKVTVQAQAVYRAKTNDYFSRNIISCTLVNGGAGWRTGDTVSCPVPEIGQTFTITITAESYQFITENDGSVSYTTPVDATGGQLSLGTIAASLVSAINSTLSTKYTSKQIGNTIYIKRLDTRDFSIVARGGVNPGITVLKDYVEDISKLPAVGRAGLVMKVRNTQNSNADDYYVKFTPDLAGNDGAGTWEETYEPGSSVNFDTSTMPHALVRGEGGDFFLRPLDKLYDDNYWGDREVGDDTSNPLPTFVGREINGMFFFRNRFGLLAGDNIIMSRPGEYFNFWVISAIAVSDADPIDITASSIRPTILRSALPITRGVMVFSDDTQYLLSTEEAIFSSATVSVTELSQYDCRQEVPPLDTGVSVMFTTETDTYTKVLEMAVATPETRPEVAEDTRVIPEYIPTGLKWGTASSTNSLIVYGDESQYCWCFKFFNAGGERSQAGWTRWELPGNVVLGALNVDTFYCVTRRGTSSVLGKISLSEAPSIGASTFGDGTSLPRLDYLSYSNDLTISGSKVYLPSGTYLAGETVTIVQVSGDSQWYYQSPTVQDDGAYYIEPPSDILAEDFWIGIEYDSYVTLPAVFVTSEGRADRTNIPIVEYISIDLFRTGYYEATLYRVGYDDVELSFVMPIADGYAADAVPVGESRSVKIPAFCRGDHINTKVSFVGPLPASATSYSWTGHYNNRGIAYLK